MLTRIKIQAASCILMTSYSVTLTQHSNIFNQFKMVGCKVSLFIAFLAISSKGINNKKIVESLEARIFSGEPVDLGNTYDFLTNDNISYSFTVILIAQVGNE